MQRKFIAGSMVVAFLGLTMPVALQAQIGGMLRRKAEDALKGKPNPAPAPATPSGGSSSGGSSSGGSSSGGTTSGSAPAAAPASAAPPARTADRTPAKPADPLDEANLDLNRQANLVLRGDIRSDKGDWESLPYISQAAVKAARALDDQARVAFVQKVGAAFKALVMSDAYTTAHNDAIKGRYKAVDHGLKGVVSLEDQMTRGGAGAEAALKRQYSANIVEDANQQSADDIKRYVNNELPDWTRYAGQTTRKDRAKYQKMAAAGQALLALGPSDLEKMRRGYAVLHSMDMDGTDNETTLYADAAKMKADEEQAAYDKHNLRAVLKSQLQTFVALVPTVDFAAQTVDKRGVTTFANPAYEKKGAVWKACFRAGKAPSQAALTFAQAWLKEL